MSMARRRPSRKELKEKRKAKRKANKELRERQEAKGLVVPQAPPSQTNRKSEYQSAEEEQAARQDATVEQLRVMRELLPKLLVRLSKIPDYRNPKKIKHRMAVLMAYGVLMFVFQMSSRREANQKMTRPMFMDNLRLFFPEIEDLPHHDTLNRLLEGIGEDVSEIESALLDLMERLIRKKKFRRYLIDNSYPIAIDGSQKQVRKDLLSPEWLERRVGKGKDGDGRTQYYVSVLEANLVFNNGMVIPLMSEFLDYGKGDTSNDKQDCETRAFYRLADRLKKRFPCLRVMVLLDGLYAQGPVMEFCMRKNWDFMIVLQDESLPSVWEEFESLKKLQSNNRLKQAWGIRTQRFRWVSDIEYVFGPNGRKRLTVHVVVCDETWEETDDKNQTVTTKKSRHAWLSSRPLTKKNVHERCNLGARHRWGIESGFLVEKRYGYYYEHCFSFNWDAMRGYHYLMRIGHALNVLVQFTSVLFKRVREMGLGRFIEFVRETMAGRWLNGGEVRKRLQAPLQLRLE